MMVFSTVLRNGQLLDIPNVIPILVLYAINRISRRSMTSAESEIYFYCPSPETFKLQGEFNVSFEGAPLKIIQEVPHRISLSILPTSTRPAMCSVTVCFICAIRGLTLSHILMFLLGTNIAILRPISQYHTLI
jgi:hypothetical protein